MNSDALDSSVFIIVSLFLLGVVALMVIVQLIIWLFTKKNKISWNSNDKSYQILLTKAQYDGTIKKSKIVTKFTNYQKKDNCLKLKTNDFEEKTLWNCYHNLISVLMVKWKKTNRKTNIALITSTVIFYLSILSTITCTLIYYINLAQDTLTNINSTLLSIFSFINLIVIVLSWLIWTMNYEKVRKEIIELADSLENPQLTKAIRLISAYKTLFPSSELLF